MSVRMLKCGLLAHKWPAPGGIGVSSGEHYGYKESIWVMSVEYDQAISFTGQRRLVEGLIQPWGPGSSTARLSFQSEAGPCLA